MPAQLAHQRRDFAGFRRDRAGMFARGEPECAKSLGRMFPHHVESIRRVTEHFSRDPEVTGLLLGGSLAHGFHSAESDVDVMIVVSDESYEERLRTRRTNFFDRELCTYPTGYVDGKYISEAFLARVAERGSEPARFAFQDARVLLSTSPLLAQLLGQAARYPREEKAARIARFQAQFEAWLWYTGQALDRQQLPLLRWAVAKLTLFGGRIVLADNELLYPYHKWFLRVLAGAPRKPPGLLELIEELALAPDRESIERFAALVKGALPWQVENWGAQFLVESELNWLDGSPPVDDL